MSSPHRPRVGVVALARATFDVPLAEEVASAAFTALETLDIDLIGPRELLFDADATRLAIETLGAQPLDLVLVLQVTFTDATMTVALAEEIAAPIALWAFPEDRSGGRLRLNSLCGINLAAHALGKAGRPVAYLYCRPGAADASDLLRDLIAHSGARREATPPAAPAPRDDTADADALALRDRLAGRRIGVVGRHPDGFDTCAYDADRLADLTGIGVEPIDLPTLFASAKAIDTDRVAPLHQRVAAELGNAGDLEAEPLEKSLRIYAALSDLAEARGLDGLAVRCWPEMFTDYGCAACGAMAMLNQDGTPCACEADVYGNVTTLILQQLADAPVFMADLVDVDTADDTAVFWHCGLAPLGMADPAEAPRATIHSNRRKPLLYEFALKPGRITVARLSQSGNRTRLVLGGAEMLRAPKSFSGTSGVVRFDRPGADVLDAIIAEGLEHHYAFAYGEHRPALRALAKLLEIQVLELC